MSKKILIADDNSEIREIVRILLESENYEVIEAIDGQDAIDKVNEETDLIILDMMMPNKSGLKACLEIREKQVHRSCFSRRKRRILTNNWPFPQAVMTFVQTIFLYRTCFEGEGFTAEVLCLSGQGEVRRKGPDYR